VVVVIEEGVGILREAIPLYMRFLVAVGYFDLRSHLRSLDEAKALAGTSPTGTAYVTYGFWQPLRRELARKNAKFWPLVVEELPHERAKQYFLAHGLSDRLVKDMTATDLNFLKRFMYTHWVGEDQAEKMLRESAICAPSRVKRIVRTERTKARNGSALERGIEKGYTHKTWVCAGDERSRKHHRARDGSKVRINEPFPATGGVPVMFPGDGPAFECVNCRCRLILSREGSDDHEAEGKI